MGRTYIFECTNCDYNAKIAGGFSEGLDFTVQTILCYECRELQDAVTSVRLPDGSDARKENPSPAPSFIELLNKLPWLGQSWARFDLVCVRFPLHRIREWSQPDKCPRCSAFMEPSDIPFRVWE